MSKHGEYVAGDISASLGPLGSLAIASFDPLDVDGKSQWSKTQTLIAIGENSKPVVLTESKRYEVSSVDGDSVTIKKTYSLRPVDDNANSFTHSGSGVITFNTKIGVPTKITYKGRISVPIDNSKVDVNIDASFTYFDPASIRQAALAKAEAAEKRKQESLAARQIRTKEALEAGRAMTKDPNSLPQLPKEHAKTLIGDLKSSDSNRVNWAIEDLRLFAPGELQNEIRAELLKRVEKHGREVVETLVTWGTESDVLQLLEGSAGRSLSRLKDYGAIDVLCKTYKTPKVATALSKAFAKYGSPLRQTVLNMGTLAEEGLLQNLADTNSIARKNSRDVLKQVGGKKAIATLKSVHSDDDDYDDSQKTIAAIAERTGLDPSKIQTDNRLTALRLTAKYNNYKPYEDNGILLNKDTRLFPGQILLAGWGSRFYPAEIVAVNEDGTVKIHYRRYTSTTFDKSLPRDQLRLAPKELPQPNMPKGFADSSDRKTDAKKALRTFILAIAMVDQDLALPVMLPGSNSDELWSIAAPPRLAGNAIKKWAETVKMKPLNVGDEFTLPNGKVYQAKVSQVSGDRQLIMIEDCSVPFILVRSQNNWMVDARVISSL